MKKLLILIAAIVISAAASPLCKAQLYRTHGYVSVANLGYPIAGAVVELPGLSCSTVTDLNGAYELNPPFEFAAAQCKADFFYTMMKMRTTVLNFELTPESSTNLSAITRYVGNVLTVLVGIYFHYGEPGYGSNIEV